MHENHAHEQYFFDDATLARLAALLAPYKFPCLLNTPMLARHFNYAHPVMIAYLARRESALLGTFARFNLAPTGLVATYQTVQPSPKTEIHFYANFPLPHS